MMVETVDRAAQWRYMAEIAENQRKSAFANQRPIEPVPKMLRRPSGLGVQVDAMIENLKADGHSPENIARVLRLRAARLDSQS
jgi:hypothetical protein